MSQPIVFILTAQKRAARRVSRVSEWQLDEDGFNRRWPNGQRPDIGVQRSLDYNELAKVATAYNEAQMRSNFLDWLYVVDVDAPVHRCLDDQAAA